VNPGAGCTNLELTIAPNLGNTAAVTFDVVCGGTSMTNVATGMVSGESVSWSGGYAIYLSLGPGGRRCIGLDALSGSVQAASAASVLVKFAGSACGQPINESATLVRRN
jgi:hypothetical protein